MAVYNYVIPASLDKQRLDKAITQLCHELSRSQIQKLISSERVKINEEFSKSAASKVKEGDIITFNFTEEVHTDLQPANIALDIVYEDADLIVINKQAGLTVHPGAGNQDNTLVNALIHHSQNLSDIGGEERPGIVHRLDKDTTGLMVVAKNNYTHADLAEQLRKRELKRKYRALIWSTMKPFKGVINLPIGRCSTNRTKMAVVKNGGREAITHYETLEIMCSGLFSLVECELDTGRTHQIRVHLSHNMHSIFGDQTYGNNARKIQGAPEKIRETLRSFTRQALHSYYLSFIHPRTGERLVFEGKMSEDMNQMMEFLRSAE